MVLRRAVLLAGLLILTVSSGYCLDVTMGRYDPAQTSRTSEKLELPLTLLWDFTGTRSDNNPTSPAVVDGAAYIACGDRVYAVDVETGKMLWKYPTDQGLGGTVKGSPAVCRGKVYFGAGDGNLYCLDSATGAFQWAYQTRGGIRCAPVVLDDVIYFGADDNSVYAVQAETGDAAWAKPFTARDDIAIGVAVGAGMAVAASMDGNIYGINSSNGRERWHQRLPTAPTETSPVIAEKVIVMAVGSQMLGLAVRSGQQRWVVSLPSEASATPAVDGTDIYVPCRDKKIYAYTFVGRQIKLKWTAPADLGSMPMSTPTVAEGVLYVTGSKGIVSAYSTLDGSLKWRYVATPSAVTSSGSFFTDAASSPVVAEESLFVLTDDGVLHRFMQAAPDNTPPVVYTKSPSPGAAIHPAAIFKLSAVLYDVGSGVDFATATMYLDDQPVDRMTDPLTATVSYQSDSGEAGKAVRPRLSEGVHTITVTVKDYRGNLLSEQWYFVADPSLPAPKRVVPDDAGKKTKEPPKKQNRPMPPSMPNPGGPPGSYDSPPPPPGMPDGAPGSGREYDSRRGRRGGYDRSDGPPAAEMAPGPPGY